MSLAKSMLWINLTLSILLLSTSAYGVGFNTYYNNFETGNITLPIYVTEGKNVTTLKGWDGLAMAVSPIKNRIVIDIYNYGTNGADIFDYKEVKEIRYEFWVGGIGNLSATVSTRFGNIFRNTAYYNDLNLNIDGKSSIGYNKIKLSNLSLQYGNGKNMESMLLFNNYNGYILGYFMVDINLQETPKKVTFTVTYPNSAGNTLQYVGEIDNPQLIGVSSKEPIAGELPSPYEIVVLFNKLPKHAMFFMDNLNIIYYQTKTSMGTPITYPIGITLLIATPIAIYFTLKKTRKHQS